MLLHAFDSGLRPTNQTTQYDGSSRARHVTHCNGAMEAGFETTRGTLIRFLCLSTCTRHAHATTAAIFRGCAPISKALLGAPRPPHPRFSRPAP